MTQTVDFAHTRKAETNRARKGEQLAVAAFDLGMVPLLLSWRSGTSHKAARKRVLERAGVVRASEESWGAADLALRQMIEAKANETCPRCGERVVEVLTELGGKRVLLDVPPHPLGHVQPVSTKSGPRARILAGSDARPDDVPLYRPHVRTCEHGERHRIRRLVDADRCPSCKGVLDPWLVMMGETDPRYLVHATCEVPA